MQTSHTPLPESDYSSLGSLTRIVVFMFLDLISRILLFFSSVCNVLCFILFVRTVESYTELDRLTFVAMAIYLVNLNVVFIIAILYVYIL